MTSATARRLTEAQLQASVTDASKWLGLLAFHPYDSRRSSPGFPDLTIVGSRGILFRELKSTTGRLTKDQERWLDALTVAGQDADVWRPDDWPRKIMAELAGIR